MGPYLEIGSSWTQLRRIKMRLSGFKFGSQSTAWCPYRKKREHRETHKEECHVKARNRN
jgi:hypothetical protein